MSSAWQPDDPDPHGECKHALQEMERENARYRKGFLLLWEMATDYKTPWVNETLRYNPLFASLYEELVQR